MSSILKTILKPSLTPFLKLTIASLVVVFATTLAAAQDFTPGLVYVCSGEKMLIDSCNIRDTSDTSKCMIGHPDHVMPNGLMQYTYMTRGEMKKLFPTCTQPSAKQVAGAHAFQQKQQDLYNANVQKANDQMKAATQHVTYGQPAPPKTPEEREMRRCVSSGRLPASCTGNQLLGAFSQMLNSVVQVTKDAPAAGPTMAGVFQGAGSWRLDFIDGGVLVNCSFLSPNQESYKLDFRNGHAVITIDTTPKPLVLTLRDNETIVGPGPVTIDGVVPSGSGGGGSTPGHYETEQVTNHQEMTALEAQPHAGESGLSNKGGGVYDLATTGTKSTYVPGTSAPTYTTFAHRRATCPALNLSSKGAGVGIQTMQTDLLKGMFGGDKGPPTPPGIRMHGIYAASSGFSLEFFPESVILGCGPDAARAYPYAVEAGATGGVVKINAPDHPLTLAFKSDGTLDPGASGPYQVHGRVVVGQDNNDDFTFAPLEQTCNLAVLTPSKAIPSSGGSASTATMVASNGSNPSNPPTASTPSTLSTPGSALGNATLSIVSGFPPQQGVPSPLAGHPYTILRDSFTTILAKVGVSPPPGTSPYKFFGMACGQRTPDCQKILDGIKASAASAVRADANGSGTLPGVPPGTYYLLISARYNNQPFAWGQAVQLKAGPNSITLDQRNAVPLN